MKRFSRVLRNFLIGYAILHLVVAGIFLFVITTWLRDQMIDQTRLRMLDMAYVLRQHIRELDRGINDPSLLPHLQILEKKTDARYTLITDSGKVVADSRTGYEEIGDHSDRPEIQQAKEEGVGFSQRTSKTLRLELLYLAVPLDNDMGKSGESGFVRVAVESEIVFSTISSLQKFLWLFTIGMGLVAGILMIVFAAREMQPLQAFANAARSFASGEYGRIPTIARRDDEWKSLADAFSLMQTELG